MKTTYPVAIMIVTAALLLAPVPGAGQAPTLARSDDQVSDQAQAERAERIARRFERNAAQLTVFDREGKLMRTVGERDMYSQPKFSPDRTRLAVEKRDFEAETIDVWVFDLATGDGTQITSSQPPERAQTPVWSPDGSQIAYVAQRGSYFGLYRKASNGEGEEELLYQHPGGVIFLTSWFPDGQLLSFSTGTADLFGGTLYFFPLDGDGQAIEVARSEASIVTPNLSPDGRFLAYRSDETGRREIFVRSVALPGGAEDALGEQWQISTEGAIGMVSWWRDGQELYYLGIDRGVMAVEVNTAQGFEFGQPRLRFKAPDAILARRDRGVGNISQDGERVVFAVPPAILQQITVLDREGKVLSTVGEPGRYGEPTLSPDGTRVAVERYDLQTGDLDIWTFDVASGQGTPVHDDHSTGFFDPIWSPDGRYVAMWALIRRPRT